MSEKIETEVTELEGSRAKVDVVVPAVEVDRAVQRAARKMAREMRMPGFRKGKAPPSLVIQRLGFPSVFEEAIRDALPEWYQRAVFDSDVVPIGDPEIQVDNTPDGEGQPLEFSFETGVRPVAELGDYLGLEVEKPEAEVPSELVDREIERLREGMARLEAVDRPAEEGDHLLADFVGRIDGDEFEGGSATDQVIEIGAGRLIDDFEDQLKGASAGGSVEVEVTFPDEYGAPELAGKDAVFSVEVKEVREKLLPEANDDFAAAASEFETIGELRADIENRIAEAFSERAEQDFRVAAIDAVVEEATVVVPEEILRARGQERWERVERQIAGQGMNPDSYLQMQGKTREEVIEESLPDAEQEIKREAVLVAVADAENIEVSDEEMEAELEHMAGHERTTPAKLLERLRRDGRDSMIAADIRVRKAIDLIVESAKPVAAPVGGDSTEVSDAEAGDGDDSVDGDDGSAESKLWTPGDPR